MKNAIKFKNVNLEKIGNDFLVTGYIKQQKGRTMFTGIIEELGKVKSIETLGNSAKLMIECKTVLERNKNWRQHSSKWYLLNCNKNSR